jgi:hypothetical protein
MYLHTGVVVYGICSSKVSCTCTDSRNLAKCLLLYDVCVSNVFQQYTAESYSKIVLRGGRKDFVE